MKPKTELDVPTKASSILKLIGRSLVEPSINKTVYCILILLEAANMLVYPIVGYIISPSALILSAKVTDESQEEYTLGIVILIGLFLTVLFLTSAIAMFILNVYREMVGPEGRSKNLMDKYLSRTLNKCNVVFRTVLFIPCLQFLLASFQLSFFSSTYPDAIWIVFGVIGLLEFTILMVMFSIMTDIFNPFSKHPWATRTITIFFLKYLMKILVVIFAQLGDSISGALTSGILALFSVCRLIHAFHSNQLFQEPQKSVWRGTLSLGLWVNLFFLMQSFDQPRRQSFTCFIFLFVGIVLCVVAVHYIFTLREDFVVRRLFENSDNKSLVPGIVETISSIESGSYLKHFSAHLFKCDSAECLCRGIAAKIAMKEEVSNENFYCMLKGIIISKMELSEQKEDLTLLLSYICLIKLNNRNQAIIMLNQLKQLDTNFITRFRTLSLESVIDHYINDISKHNAFQMQVERCYLLNKLHTDFRALIFKVCNNIIDFWKILSAKDQKRDMLYSINRQIIKDSGLISKEFNDLYNLNPSNTSLVAEYIEFRLRFFSEDTAELKRTLSQAQKVMNGNGSYLSPIEALFLDTAEPSILVVTANHSKFNVIHYANATVLKKLSYFSSNLLGKSLDILLPAPFKDGHEEHLNRYIHNKDIDSGVELRVQMLDRDGSIELCSIIVTMLNNISEGLLFVAFTSFSKGEERLIFATEEGVIYGCSKQFVRMYGKCMDTRMQDLLPGTNFTTLEQNEVVECRMLVKPPRNADFEEKLAADYNTTLRLKEVRVTSNGRHFVFEVDVDERSDVLLDAGRRDSEESTLSQIDFEADNNTETDGVKDIFSEVLFKKSQPVRILLFRVIGLLVLLMFIGLAVYNFHHLLQEMGLLVGQYNSQLSLSKSNLRITDNSFVARRMNIQAYFMPNDTNTFNAYQSLYKTSIAKMNSVYYDMSSTILDIKGRGFSDSETNLSVTYWEFPNSKKSTELYHMITMYIQSASFLGTSSMANMSFPSIRQPNSSLDLFQSEFMDISINTYASILPTFNVITDAILKFWDGQLNNAGKASYVVLAMVVVAVVLLTAAVIVTDQYYVRKFQRSIEILLDLPKGEVDEVISTLENYQYTMFLEYYETNWVKALYELFEDTNRKNKYSLIKAESGNNSGLVTPFETERKSTRRQMKHKSSKLKAEEVQQKIHSKHKLQSRSTWHIVWFIVLILLILAYFVSEFVLAGSCIDTLWQSSRQFSRVLERMRLISTLRYTTVESMFEIAAWPTNVSLIDQSISYRTQLLANEKLLQQSKTTYPEWTSAILKLNQANICADYAYYGANNDYNTSSQNCTQTSEGALTRGFSFALTVFTNTAQGVQMMLKNNINDAAVSSMIFNPVFVEFNCMTEYLLSASKSLRNLYQKVMTSQQSMYSSLFRATAFAFVGVMVLLLLVWRCVTRRICILSEEVKGLMKLMTVGKIEGNSALMSDLLLHNIIQSVR